VNSMYTLAKWYSGPLGFLHLCWTFGKGGRYFGAIDPGWR